jgi:hypothetical protein
LNTIHSIFKKLKEKYNTYDREIESFEKYIVNLMKIYYTKEFENSLDFLKLIEENSFLRTS